MCVIHSEYLGRNVAYVVDVDVVLVDERVHVEVRIYAAHVYAGECDDMRWVGENSIGVV